MSKCKQWLKEKWYYVLAGLTIIGGVIAAILAFSRSSTNDGKNLPSPVQDAKTKLHENISKARIDAAVEIATSRGEENIVKEEVKQIIENTSGNTKEDKKKQLEQLAALAKRTRRR